MKSFSQKVFFKFSVPTEEEPASDQNQLLKNLAQQGFSPVTLPLKVLQKLYPLCRESRQGITATLVYHGKDWVVTDLEPVIPGQGTMVLR